MAVPNFTLPIKQGSTLEQSVTFAENADGSSPIDLTGWTFRGQLRKTYSATDKIVDLTFETNAPATDGVLWIKLTAAQTAAIEVDAASTYRKKMTNYVYDIEAVKVDGSVDRILEGTAEISPEATR